MAAKRDIAIVGAGPAGLAAALYLRRAGHRATIFERFETPAPVGSGLILQPTGLTVLADLGLLSDILTLGSRIDRLHGADAKTGRTVLNVRYDALSGGRFGLAVHRAALFNVLNRAVSAENISIVTATEVDGLDAGSDGIALKTVNARMLGKFDLVIDASGARSKLRSFAYHPVDPKPLAYGAFWASLRWRDGFDENALLQRYDRASIMVGVLPIGRAEPNGEEMAAFFWSLKPADAERIRADGLQKWKQDVHRVWPQCSAFTEQVANFEQLSLARYGHHTMVLPIGPKLAVIGDAAHSASPQLGQGANMALLDTRALAYAISATDSIDAALYAYARARRWHVRVFQALSMMFTPFYQSDSTALPIIRDRLVAALARIPPARQILAAMVAGTIVDPFGPLGLTEFDWLKGRGFE